GLRGGLSGRGSMPPGVSPWNYVWLPALASALTFIVFFPGIIRQGAATYFAATGQTQDPFLQRWLLLTGAFFAISAVCYAIRLRIQAHCFIDRDQAGASRDAAASAAGSGVDIYLQLLQ